jgi:hypothetical protein
MSAKVEPYDHPLRFLVVSDTQPDVSHLVDLGEFEGKGKCSCQHFEFRIQPDIEVGLPHKRCKHIDAARCYLADAVIEKLRKA